VPVGLGVVGIAVVLSGGDFLDERQLLSPCYEYFERIPVCRMARAILAVCASNFASARFQVTLPFD
jgi:hypothetical protein